MRAQVRGNTFSCFGENLATQETSTNKEKNIVRNGAAKRTIIDLRIFIIVIAVYSKPHPEEEVSNSRNYLKL